MTRSGSELLTGVSWPACNRPKTGLFPLPTIQPFTHFPKRFGKATLASQWDRWPYPPRLLDAVLRPGPLRATGRLTDGSILLPARGIDIGPCMLEVKADRLVANLPKPHTSMVQPLSELTIKATVDQPFVEAVYTQGILSPD